MTRVLLTAGLLLLALPACGKKPTERDCDQLRDHMVTLELASSSAGADQSPAAVEEHKKVSAYLGQDFLDTCLKDLPVEQVACGLKARTLDELSACDKS